MAQIPLRGQLTDGEYKHFLYYSSERLQAQVERNRVKDG